MADKKTPQIRKKKSSSSASKVAKNSNLTGQYDFVNGDSFSPATQHYEMSIQERYDLFIDGRWVKPFSKKRLTSYNPATGEAITEISLASHRDIDAAVHAARSAYEDVWTYMTGQERGKYLFRLARLIQDRSREFAFLESLDTGKPMTECRDVDLPLVSAHFFYYAGWADKLDFAFPGRKARSIGVAAQVIPWNSPLLMAAWKLAPALACGNTIVLKPYESSSLTVLKLAELIEEAGFPEGVVNIVTGDYESGEYLMDHPVVDKVAYTGSNSEGKEVMSSLAGSGKRFTLDLGGKSAHIVFDDAPLDEAVDGIIRSICFHQGHTQRSGLRLLVQESLGDKIIEKLKRRMSQLSMGDPLDCNNDVGPVNNIEQLEKIQALVEGAMEDGVEVWSAPSAFPDRGIWYAPTLLLHSSLTMEAVKQELYGPVLTVETFRTPQEAIANLNNSSYGLSASVWTEKGSKAQKIISEIKSGVMWVNTSQKSDPASPYGGVKESGIGREGGVHGLTPYIELVDPSHEMNL